MTNIIYGVDLDQGVTPLMARDAVISCFKNAHKEMLEQLNEFGNFKTEEEFEEMKDLNVKVLIRTMMEKRGGSFDDPRKEDIVNLCTGLAEYSKVFRSEDVIKKNFSEMKKIIERIE